MQLLSLTEYAATHGVTRQATKKWRDAGLIVFVGDQVDVAASDKKMAAHGRGRFRVTRHGGARHTGERADPHPPGWATEAEAPPPKRRGNSVVAPVDPWRTPAWQAANPHCLGGQIETVAKLIASHVDCTDPETAVLIEDLLDHADTVMCDELVQDCRLLGWAEWPASISAAIAGDVGLRDLKPAIETSLAKQMAHRLLALGHGPEDIAAIRASGITPE